MPIMSAVFILFFPFMVFGAVIYERNPIGNEITSPVSLHIAVDSWVNACLDMRGSGCVGNWYYNIGYDYPTGTGHSGYGILHADSKLDVTENFDLPVGAEVWDINLRFGSYQMILGGFILEEASEAPLFTVIESPTISPPEASSRLGVANSSPEVKLTSEIFGTYRGELPIYYSAADPDSGSGALKSLPIIIFYSDDGGISWKELVKDQPNTGVYTFDTAKVPDGANYKIRVVALDGYDYFGEKISGSFSIDNTGPTFDISVSPFPIREKDTILLKITSSEELKTLPELQITQKDAEPKIVTVSGSKKEFSAVYYVERGAGKAVISVLGEDLMGNIGETIASGGRFLVGLYGPPPPIIISPTNNQIFTQQAINITGSSQPDTEIILNLNGVSTSTAQSSEDGSFKIDNVVLSAANKGYNTFSIVALDKKNEESEEVVLKIKLNIPPKISSTSIVEGETLSGQKEIGWVSFDPNDDKLVFSIEYSNDRGITWDYIISDFSETSYKIDTLQLADGSDYFLKITADDGIEKTSQIFKKITIKNNLPHISLDIPANYFTNSNTPVLTGKVTGSEQSIILAEYSLDGGATWQSAIALDGEFNSLIEKIKISISEPLEDGKYAILIRATDALNRSVKISRSFSVDTIPPVLESPPLLDQIINNDMDTNLELDGLQVVFPGKTEPKVKIRLILEDKIYKTTPDKKGDFEFKDVTLPLHGPNKISLISSDSAGNITEITGVVISNNPPKISISSPKKGMFFGGVEEISWEVQDLDKDLIVSKILYQKKNEARVVLAEDLAGNIYKWDASKITSGEYAIKIIVSDGITEAEEILNVFIDNVVPQVTFSGPSLTNIVRPAFSGEASDDFSGIQVIEYSFNNIDWYKALINKGYRTQKVSFNFQHNFPLPDGEYGVRVRASDRAGNIAYSEPLNLTIDSIPPRIGSNLISSGALILFPEENGVIKLFKDAPYQILASVAEDAREVSLKAKEMTFGFNFNKATLLWESEFNFKDSGDYSLVISARDEAGNSQTKEIAVLTVIPRGSVYNEKTNERIKEAKITLYSFDQNTNSWSIFDARAFGQQNPQETDTTGEFGFLVPPGKYQLEISHHSFKTVRSETLEIKKNYLININIPMAEKGIFNKILNYFLQL